MIMNTTLNYSPNFNKKKRNSSDIKFIIFHYTGMKNENDAIKKLTNFKSKVSCHYFIKSNGKILTKAFQRRFRQNLINGIIDQECLIISENLSKKFNKTS